MAMGVVDVFEVINKDDAKRPPLSLLPRRFAVQRVQYHATIGDPGQQVMGRTKEQLFLGLYEVFLQVQNALAYPKAAAQLLAVERLGQIVVRSEFESLEEVRLLGSNRE